MMQSEKIKAVKKEQFWREHTLTHTQTQTQTDTHADYFKRKYLESIKIQYLHGMEALAWLGSWVAKHAKITLFSVWSGPMQFHTPLC